jgi:uncharacterized membrane protein
MRDWDWSDVYCFLIAMLLLALLLGLVVFLGLGVVAQWREVTG